MTTGKAVALLDGTFVGKVISLLFNMLSRLVIAFLPRSKHLLISWLQSPSAVILEPRKIKSASVSTVSPSISHDVMDQMPWSSFSECWALSQLLHLLFHFHQRLFSSSSLSAIRVVSFAHHRFLHCNVIDGYWYFSQQSWFQLVLPPAQRFSWCTLHRS